MKKILLALIACAICVASSVTTTNTSSSGGGTWGSITGTLSNQTDLQTELSSKVTNSGVETITGAKTFSSALSVPLGTVGAPGLYTGTDTDTGLYSPGANQIALAAGGANKFISDTLGGIRLISTGNNSLGHSATFSLSGGGAGAAGLAISRGTFDTSMPGGVWYTASAPSGGTQNIGFRADMDGGTISSYGFGIYIQNNTTNSSTSTFAPYNASGGNVGGRFDVTVANDTGQAMGLAATGGQGKLNAGGVFQGIQPRDVSGNQVFGVRAHGARANASMTFPSQVVGVYGWITDTNSAAVEQRDPGISSAGIFDNGDTTANIFTALDNGGSVFQVQDSGNVIVGAQNSSATHVLNGTVRMATATSNGSSLIYGNYVMNPQEYNNGNSGTAITINLGRASAQKVTMNNNCTFTLSSPQVGGSYVLKLVQDATGSRTATWPGSVLWPGGVAPTLSGANKTDLINLYFDGTNYLGSFSLNY